MVCSFLSASAPPCAATACFTRSAADCADAGLVSGLASDAPNTSATVDTTIRNMEILPVGKHVGLRCPLSRALHSINPGGARLFGCRAGILAVRHPPGAGGAPGGNG